jgi:putative spermidine/putrescine transport system permease protein
VLGVAILQLVALFGFGVSVVTLVAGHLVICLPYTTRLLAAALRGMDENTERAAATLGASAWHTFRRVTLPYLRPALVAAAFIAANVSFDDVGISLFLSNAETQTLPVRIFHYLEYQFAPFIAALGTLLIIVPVLAAIAIERWFGLGRLFGIGAQRRASWKRRSPHR